MKNATETNDVAYAECPVCGDRSFPVHEFSPCGHLAEPDLHDLAAAGTVYSWSRVNEGGSTVVIAMADFLDDTVRISAPVIGVGEIAIGDSVQVVKGDDLPYVLVTTSSLPLESVD